MGRVFKNNSGKQILISLGNKTRIPLPLQCCVEILKEFKKHFSSSDSVWVRALSLEAHSSSIKVFGLNRQWKRYFFFLPTHLNKSS